MALPTDPAFYACSAAACAVLVCVVLAAGTGRIRVFGPTYAAGVIVGSLLATRAFYPYLAPVPVSVAVAKPEPRADAAAVECPLADGGHVWLVLLVIAGCAFGGIVVAAFRAFVEAVGRRMPPRVPGRRGHAGRRATGWRTLVELVLFLVSVWACVYCFPAVVRNYMAATAKGGGPAAT